MRNGCDIPLIANERPGEPLFPCEGLRHCVLDGVGCDQTYVRHWVPLPNPVVSVLTLRVQIIPPVREQRADTLEALPLLQDQIATDREVACKAEAEKRLSQGIPRACGSYVCSYADAGKRLVEAARQYAERARQLG